MSTTTATTIDALIARARATGAPAHGIVRSPAGEREAVAYPCGCLEYPGEQATGTYQVGLVDTWDCPHGGLGPECP